VADVIGENQKGNAMLTQRRVERTNKPGRYGCGLVRGLYLQISNAGAKSWVLRYERHGKERMMGLGSVSDFTLKEVRERARQARQLLSDGVDPLATKHASKQAAKLAEARKLTFREAAQRYFDQHESKWRNATHREAFLGTLGLHVFPLLGDMDVAAIDTPDVLRALEPIWKTKSITADRTRNRIEAVIDWAVVRGHRPAGTNPARWKGHLDQVLPAARKMAPVEHHKAMDYRELPAFLKELRHEDGSGPRALEFLILTAARTGEVMGAVWDEIDSDAATWVIPGSRMKGGREHRVPLSPQAVDLLKKLPREKGNPFVFIGRRPGTGLSHIALPWTMERMGLKGSTTVHGFRSSFSNWAHEQTAHSSHTIELSLAHNVGTEVERAYRRTDMIAKRRQLMEQWSKFCTSPPAKVSGDVIALRGAR
jgi:integrase